VRGLVVQSQWKLAVQERTCQQHNGLVPHLVANLHWLEDPHNQVLELVSGTVAPDNFHQSQTHQERNMVQ
jgi:hypothetical protein